MLTISLRQTLRYLGVIITLLGVAMAGMAAWSGMEVWLGDAAERMACFGLFGSALAALALGATLWFSTDSRPEDFGQREAFLLVTFAWLVGAAFTAVPYFVWSHLTTTVHPQHPFLNPINCYFEAMSGLTTTGATVLSDVASLPRSLLLWRSTTHWIGGLGIVLLFVAVLPALGASARKLVFAEGAYPLHESDRPSVRQTTRVLWIVYAAITLTGVVALRFSGMNWFDSVNHAFAAIATGGFGTENANMGAFRSLSADIIVIVLMVLGGINFGLYCRLMNRGFRQAVSDPEFRFYMTMLVVVSAVGIVGLIGFPIVTTTGETLEPSLGNSIRYGLFNIISLHTDTGFATADFDKWPVLSKAALMIGAFVGGSSGSTTGGIKVVRLLLLFKIMLATIQRFVSKKVVVTVRLGSNIIDERTQNSILSHILMFILVLVAGTIALIELEPENSIDITTAATASLATLCTAGPGLSLVGPAANFGWFSDGSTGVMCLLMVAGRLELLAFFAALTPGFWRTK